MQGVISSATVGNWSAEVVDGASSFDRDLVISECVGGTWVVRKRTECPVSAKEAASLLACVNTVATPTYERIINLVAY